MSPNSQETPAPEETPVNFAKSLRTPFLQNNSGQLLLKCGHCKNEAREKQCSLFWLKSQRAREVSHQPAFMGICPIISHMY